MRTFHVSIFATVCLAKAPCPPVELVYGNYPQNNRRSSKSICTARATTEPPQNAGTGQQFDSAASRVWSKGYGAAGYTLLTNITALIPNAVGYPVHYPVRSLDMRCFNKWLVLILSLRLALLVGPVRTLELPNMQEHLKARTSACLETKFVLGGHS
jgi:hypothetical protein